MLRYFDTHSHLVDTLDERGVLLDEHILKAQEAGVTHILDPGISPDDFERRRLLLETYPNVLMGIAFGPHGVKPSNVSQINLIEDFIKKYKPAAISEIGLDYQANPDNKDLQNEIFSYQLGLAEKYELPVFLHIRNLYGEVSEIVRKHKGLKKVIVHCFTGGVEEAKIFLNLGCVLSFPGVVTFKNAKELKEAARYCPIEQMVVETDSPYLAPVPYRGRPNQSAYLPLIVKALAELREEKDEESFTQRLYKNSLSIFNLPE